MRYTLSQIASILENKVLPILEEKENDHLFHRETDVAEDISKDSEHIREIIEYLRSCYNSGIPVVYLSQAVQENLSDEATESLGRAMKEYERKLANILKDLEEQKMFCDLVISGGKGNDES